MSAKSTVQNLASLAGITINGNNPWDIHVHNEKLYDRVMTGGSLALGESYMDGWWDCEKLDEFFYRIFTAEVQNALGLNAGLIMTYLFSKLFNLQTVRRSRKVAEEHYDLPSAIYMSFLDPYNQYTCGYYEADEDLNTAQLQCLEMIAEKLRLKHGDQVLDIGCGWGGFAKFAAEHFGCAVTGVSISKEQINYAQGFCKGLPVRILYCDYRDLAPKYTGAFDKILSRGMIEHVGYKNYRRMMKTAHQCLNDNPDSLFLLDCLGRDLHNKGSDRWITKYIFPNSVVPELSQITQSIEGLFVVEDIHNFGACYDKTLMTWHENFVREWPLVKDALRPYYDATLNDWARSMKGDWFDVKEKYHKRFYRKFRYYFLCCAAAFRARNLQQWQFVFSKEGYPGGYRSVR